MDLLQSSWIPVREGTAVSHISFEQLLCTSNCYQLSLPRDDMELAALQLLISLAQCIFSPKDRNELLQRWKQPLTPETYHQAVETFGTWFMLDHQQYPFMQTQGVRAKEVTPIQKLFIGLPEGNNHALFNDKGEIAAVCASCAAIALFNQASNCPSFGGGFKANLRGSAPITTFAAGNHLRETLWFNVLSQDRVADLPISQHANNTPVWVDPIPARGKMYAYEIGLLRGLFWQPAQVELLAMAGLQRCDACRQMAERSFSSFRKEKFVYDIEGLWPHPHSPKRWDIKKDAKERERFLSFTTQAPAWTQLNHCAFGKTHDTKEGSEPSRIVTQFRQVFGLERRKLILLVSGYRNSKASILERRHELFSMPQDWDHQTYIEHGIQYALDVKQELRSKLYGFAKQVGPNVHETAERQFYQATESLIHGLLRKMDFPEGKAILRDFKDQLARLASEVFESLTAPYCHAPKGLKYFLLFKRRFEAALAKLSA